MLWKDGLTDQALTIAATPGPQFWVVAGPSTGKTAALIQRIADLPEEDRSDPRRISRTSTLPPAEAASWAIGEHGAQRATEIHAHTVHGFCFSMLSSRCVLEVT